MHARRGHARAAAALVAAAVVVSVAGPVAAAEQDPPWSVPEEDLAAALDCPDTFAHPEHEPVLLVHGTFTYGHEQFDWNWLAVLPGMGFDVCVVTYPDRGLGDQQVSAEYVAHAIITMHEATGQQVDLMGHSQGASMPRWAVRFWPTARAAVDDYVGIAGPYHGTDAVASGQSGQGGEQPEAFFQFQPDSRFVTILNEGDETPGEIDWTNLYTQFDELVQPVSPEPTASLDWQQDNPRVANLLVQDLCPGRVVDHLSIGTTDRLAFDLAVDAFTHDGPADPARLDLGPACSIADQLVEDPQQAAALADLVFSGFATGLPALHTAAEEPPTRDYARADAGAADGDDEGAETAGTTTGASQEVSGVVGAVEDDTTTRSLPSTGGGFALAALGGLAAGAALRRRR